MFTTTPESRFDHARISFTKYNSLFDDCIFTDQLPNKMLEELTELRSNILRCLGME
jgi:hypothetical protein